MIQVVCGLPGAGKSTFAKTLGLPVHDFDDWIVKRMGCPFVKAMELFMTHNSERFYTEFLAEALSHDDAVLVDVLPTVPERRLVLDASEKRGLKARAWWLDTPLTVCIKRNRKRCTPVDESVIMSMARTAEEPQTLEGFEYVTIVRGC